MPSEGTLCLPNGWSALPAQPGNLRLRSNIPQPVLNLLVALALDATAALILAACLSSRTRSAMGPHLLEFGLVLLIAVTGGAILTWNVLWSLFGTEEWEVAEGRATV